MSTECYLYGRTSFEDNIEDEYFIIFLLRELTLLDSRLVVKINDEDGEILLIESALYLDKWAQDPRRTENRVYLRNGEVHIISPSIKPNWTSLDSRHFPKEAAQFILENATKTRGCDAIQQCILNRIKAYPSNIEALQHRAHCHLPLTVASLLQHNPKLVSHAVRAFYFRTAEDLKSIIRMKHFSAQDCILTNVRFTRCLYAQLTSQEFKPDKRSDWQIPSTDAPNYGAFINGFKITAGFEMLLSQYFSNKNAKEGEADNAEDDEGKKHMWAKFLASLEGSNYFDNNLVGSKPYNDRLQQCKHFFSNMFVNFNQLEAEYNVGKQIHDFLQSVNIEEERQKWQSLALEAEDDDSWLHLDQGDLDALLAEKFGCAPTSNVTLDDISKGIPETIKKFVFNENSGLNGAEAPKKKSDNHKSCNTDKIEFNQEEFDNFVKEIQFLVEKKPNLDDLIDGYSTDSSMGDYGSEDEFDDQFAAPETAVPFNGSSKRNDNSASEIEAYLKQMDSELSTTVMAKSFNKRATLAQLDSDDEEGDGDEETEIDLNVLSNILESYSGEAEMSTSVGPATALFATMGAKLPDIERN